MFHKADKPPAIPAWDKNGKGPAAPPAAPPSTPAFAAAIHSNAAEVAKNHDPYDVVLEAVKDELKSSRRLAPSAYDNPTDEDYAVVMEVARRQIQSYNLSAATRGLSLMVDGSESEMAA